ncbi:MAG: hypothetical protein JST84_02220 [Acidobacteria bacterium]|nr:hypothetical protein [Acidobacteriota bacterium]
MSNKCSKCGLVNWAQETHCRRCGVELSGAGQAEFAPLRSRIQAEDFKSREDHDPAFDEAKALIKKGVNAGMVYGGISLVLVLFFQAFIPSAEAYYKFAFLDVGIIYGLTYGIHTKSRVCAALMLGYYVLSKIVMLTQGRTGLIGIVVAIAFAKSFYQSYQGTTLYQQIKQSRTAQPHA